MATIEIFWALFVLFRLKYHLTKKILYYLMEYQLIEKLKRLQLIFQNILHLRSLVNSLLNLFYLLPFQIRFTQHLEIFCFLSFQSQAISLLNK